MAPTMLGETDPTLLRYASVIREKKKCWELLAEKFDRFQTLCNNMQQGVQTDATCNIQQCCVRLHGALSRRNDHFIAYNWINKIGINKLYILTRPKSSLLSPN